MLVYVPVGDKTPNYVQNLEMHFYTSLRMYKLKTQIFFKKMGAAIFVHSGQLCIEKAQNTDYKHQLLEISLVCS